MVHTRLVSLKSVLYDLSTIVEEKYWNETLFYEWAAKGFLKFQIPAKYETCVAVLTLEGHKAQLPVDAETILQIGYKVRTTESDITELLRILGLEDTEWNRAREHMAFPEGLALRAFMATLQNQNSWAPMRLSTNPFLQNITSDVSLYTDTYYDNDVQPICVEHQYTVQRGCITSTLRNGVLLVAYTRKVRDGNDFLIPDNEDLKEAILHYCLYRHWMVRASMKEEGAAQLMTFHLERYDFLKRKASAVMPTIDELENIKNQRQDLVPRHHHYASFFQNLGAVPIHPNANYNGRF